MKNLFSKLFLRNYTFWDYEPTKTIHVDNPGVYTSNKILDSSTIDKIYVKCDVLNGSIVNGIREPILFNFILDKPTGYQMFCELKTIHLEKIIESVLNTMGSSLEDDNHKENDFNRETFTSTLQLIKIWTTKRAFKTLKLIFIALVGNTTVAQKTLLVR